MTSIPPCIFTETDHTIAVLRVLEDGVAVIFPMYMTDISSSIQSLSPGLSPMSHGSYPCFSSENITTRKAEITNKRRVQNRIA
jgi:hypothetical protein